MKRIWRVCLLALLLGLLLYGTALAEIYTVTIEPGEGSGSAFTVQSTSVISREEMLAGNYNETKGCFYLDSGTFYYRFPRRCAFTAPENKEFDCWQTDSGSTFSGNETLEASNFTITALWKDQEAQSSVTLSIPTTINVNYGDTQTAFDIQVKSVTFNQGAQALDVSLWNSAFVSSDTDGSIPFTMSTNGQGPGSFQNGCTFSVDQNTALPYSCQGYINITSAAWAGAAPGTYTSTIKYQIEFLNGEEDQYGTITLTLTVPGQKYAVTVHGGTGSGDYAEGESVTITANAPETGKRFKEWTGADGLTFTSGSAATATFTMPASAVTLTATYEDVRHAITCSDGTAVALHEVGWLDWQPAAEAAAGEALELQLVDGAEPADGRKFTGEFAVNGVSLGVAYDENDENHLFPLPVTELTMPAEAISIKAVQAARERVTLDFSQAAALAMPCMALVQLRNGENTAALFTSDEDWNEFIDLNGSGTPDLAVTEPDYVTTADFTLTLLADCDAFGAFAFDFTGPTDRYGMIAFMLPSVAVPTFGTPDFTLPAAVQAIEANAFEGIAASIVDVPAGCASIGDHAFKDCKRLTQIRIPADCQLGQDVFDGCARVTIFGAAGSSAEAYCRRHANCAFVAKGGD